MVKAAAKPQTVEFVIWIGIVQLLEELQLLDASLVPTINARKPSSMLESRHPIAQTSTMHIRAMVTHIISLFLMTLIAASDCPRARSLTLTTLLKTP